MIDIPSTETAAIRGRSTTPSGLKVGEETMKLYGEETGTRSALRRWSVVGGIAIALGSLGMAGCDGGDAEDAGGLGGESSSGGASSGGSSSGGTSSGGAGGAGCSTIVELAQATPELSTLVAAVTKAGLAEALGGDDLTVFAPTNEAFADLLDALGVESLDDLTAEQLTPIVLYHVVDGVVEAEAALELAAGEGEFMSLGGVVAIEGDAEAGLVLDPAEFPANIVLSMTDIQACNGVVHVIDGVIVPSITDIVTTSATLSSLAGLVVAADGEAGTTPKVGAALDGDSPAGSWTVFAPSNAAIAALSVSPAPSGQDLTNVLLYHAVASADPVFATDALAFDNQSVETALGEDITVDGGTSVTIAEGDGGAATVVTPDIIASNGVIHVIDKVLLPPN